MLAVQARGTGPPEGKGTVKKLQTFILAALVAATIGLGGEAAAPSPAHAAPMAVIKCADAMTLADAYICTGDYWMAADNPLRASYYYGKASAITQAAC
jgi:hypothetical protein